jgi:hypothetical protein
VIGLGKLEQLALGALAELLHRHRTAEGAKRNAQHEYRETHDALNRMAHEIAREYLYEDITKRTAEQDQASRETVDRAMRADRELGCADEMLERTTQALHEIELQLMPSPLH